MKPLFATSTVRRSAGSCVALKVSVKIGNTIAGMAGATAYIPATCSGDGGSLFIFLAAGFGVCRADVCPRVCKLSTRNTKVKWADLLIFVECLVELLDGRREAKPREQKWGGREINFSTLNGHSYQSNCMLRLRLLRYVQVKFVVQYGTVRYVTSCSYILHTCHKKRENKGSFWINLAPIHRFRRAGTFTWHFLDSWTYKNWRTHKETTKEDINFITQGPSSFFNACSSCSWFLAPVLVSTTNNKTKLTSEQYRKEIFFEHHDKEATVLTYSNSNGSNPVGLLFHFIERALISLTLLQECVQNDRVFALSSIPRSIVSPKGWQGKPQTILA